MSITVKQLNADTTFLITLAPAFARTTSAHAPPQNFPADFTILIDPWLRGRSTILHPAFQVSHHTRKPCVESLADFGQHERPHLIIISQDKPDHCHEETLKTLPRDSDIGILATPAAAKKITSWNWFRRDVVRAIQPYSADEPETIVAIPLPAYSSRSSPGEVTLANLPPKRDITGLHNAIGITYRPPGTTLHTQAGSHVNLPLVTTPPASPDRPPLSHSSPTTSTPLSSASSRHDSARRATQSEKTLSLLYTPHGVHYSAVAPYASTHLVPLSALPLTILFHSLNVEANPWFMGGVLAGGAPCGEVLARRLGAQNWISAHDEVKDNRGFATVMMKSRRYAVAEVEAMLADADNLGGALETVVRKLWVGETVRIEG